MNQRTFDAMYVFRLPSELRAQIKARAALNRRSMNMEMIFLIENALAAETAAGAMVGASSPAAADIAGTLAGADTSTRY